MPRHPACLIVNPAAGRARHPSLLAALERRLANRGFEVQSRLTEGPGHAAELARTAAAAGATAVFALGGDGTIREAATGLLGSPAALAPLPGGTTNVLTHHLGLPSRPLAAAGRFDGRGPLLATRVMDVGLCGAHPFLMMTSLGLDAMTMLAVSARAKRRWGRLAVLAEGLRQLRQSSLPHYRVRVGGHEICGSFVALCNIAEYAGSFRLAPTADPTDGALDVVVFGGSSRPATLGLAVALVAGRHTRRADVQMLKVREAEIWGPTESAVEIDGDGMLLELPLRVGLDHRRLMLLEPAAAGEGL